MALTLTALTRATSDSFKADNGDKRIEIIFQSRIRGGISAVTRDEALLSSLCSIILYVA